MIDFINRCLDLGIFEWMAEIWQQSGFQDSSPSNGCLGICPINTLRPKQNGLYFTDDTFKRIYLNENVRICIKISLKLVPVGQINNIPALVQIIVWRQAIIWTNDGQFIDAYMCDLASMS